MHVSVRNDQTTKKATARLGLAVFFMLAQFVFSLVALGYLVLGMMDVSCLENCDYGPTFAAFWIMAVASIVVIIASMAAVVLARRNNRNATWIQLAGIFLIVVAYFFCRSLQSVGA
jgi:heme/copper-type cytochrome/quinol oxidase subunit 3